MYSYVIFLLKIVVSCLVADDLPQKKKTQPGPGIATDSGHCPFRSSPGIHDRHRRSPRYNESRETIGDFCVETMELAE